MDFVSAINK